MGRQNACLFVSLCNIFSELIQEIKKGIQELIAWQREDCLILVAFIQSFQGGI